MKFAALCLFFILHVATVTGRFTRDDNKLAHSSSVSPGVQTSHQRSEPLIQGRRRALFARRGLHERQRVQMQKPRVVPAPPNPPPPKVAPNPPRCPKLAESCLPQSRCCDPCTTCHCRFFNAICFCRKMSSQCEKDNVKTATR